MSWKSDVIAANSEGTTSLPAEEDELQQIAGLYPEEVERLRTMVERRRSHTTQKIRKALEVQGIHFV